MLFDRSPIRVAAALFGASACVLAAPVLSAVPDWPPDVPLVLPDPEAPRVEPPDSIRIEPVGERRFRCSFLVVAEDAQSVALVGSFNGWNANATPMAHAPMGRGGPHGFEVTLELPEGEHTYKFAVDETWIADPENDVALPDGYGGRNSVLALGAFAVRGGTGAELGDGRFDHAGLAHDPGSVRFLQRAGERRWSLRLRTWAADVERVELAVEGAEPAAMAHVLRTARFDWWELSLDVHEEADAYTFLLHDGSELARHPEVFSLAAAPSAAFTTPDWAKEAVWYQIMLDRFRSGDSENDPPGVHEWTSEWYAPSKAERRTGQSFYRYDVFQRLYGGDLAGLRESLDYLSELGITALYLNPIFQASTHHKYNATNFLHVDEHFGAGDDYAAAEAAEDLLDPSTWTFTETDRLFLDFVKEAKSRGIRVVLDGVFNHVGTLHPAFRDVQEKGAESRFADWFSIRSFEPFEYEGWAGFGELPVFAKTATGFASDEVKQHIFDVTRRWMDPDGDGDPSDGIDGWRLDVPNEVAQPFWEEWRALVKSINPDALICGEIWQRAESWLDGRTFDAVMNYPFAEVAVEWIGHRQRKITASEADRRLAELRLAYPGQVTAVLWNLVDSHDTDRLVSQLLNPDRDYDRENREQENPDYDASKPSPDLFARARLIALLQMTYVGAPVVYYGDEIGMWGSDDPNNRKPMVWEHLGRFDDRQQRVDKAHLAFYRDAIALRQAHPALRTGSFRTVLVDDDADVWAFVRESADEQCLVVLNASDTKRTVELEQLGDGWELVFGEADGEPDRARVPGVSGSVWRRSML